MFGGSIFATGYAPLKQSNVFPGVGGRSAIISSEMPDKSAIPVVSDKLHSGESNFSDEGGWDMLEGDSSPNNEVILFLHVFRSTFFTLSARVLFSLDSLTIVLRVFEFFDFSDLPFVDPSLLPLSLAFLFDLRDFLCPFFEELERFSVEETDRIGECLEED